MINNGAKTYLELAARRMMAMRKRKKLPRQLAPKYPHSLEREYQRDLNTFVRTFADAIKSIILPQLPSLVSSFETYRPAHLRKDAAPDDLERLLQQARIYLDGRYSVDQLRRVIQARAFDISSWNKTTIANNIERVIGINPIIADASLGSEIALFTATNVGLINSLKEKAFNDVSQTVYTGFASGARAETIAKDITKLIDPEVGNVKARADLIARDQVGKLNSQLTQVRQSNLGVTRYRWRTLQDERVRGAPGGLYPNAVPSHYDKEGKIFSWDKPPADTGHPGDDFQCRCYAEPVLEDLVPGLDDLDDDE